MMRAIAQTAGAVSALALPQQGVDGNYCEQESTGNPGRCTATAAVF